MNLPRVKAVDRFPRHMAVKSQIQHVVDTASNLLNLRKQPSHRDVINHTRSLTQATLPRKGEWTRDEVGKRVSLVLYSSEYSYFGISIIEFVIKFWTRSKLR